MKNFLFTKLLFLFIFSPIQSAWSTDEGFDPAVEIAQAIIDNRYEPSEDLKNMLLSGQFNYQIIDIDKIKKLVNKKRFKKIVLKSNDWLQFFYDLALPHCPRIIDLATNEQLSLQDGEYFLLNGIFEQIIVPAYNSKKSGFLNYSSFILQNTEGDAMHENIAKAEQYFKVIRDIRQRNMLIRNGLS